MHPLKDPFPIDTTVVGISIELNDEQLKNELSQIFVIGDKIWTFFNSWHPEKMPHPINIVETGMTMPVNDEQHSNADSSMNVTEGGI